MSNARLKNILNFSVAGGGGSQSIAHGLNINGSGVVPDEIKATGAGSSLVITADAVNVTVTNNGTTLATVSALVEHWHTTERAFNVSPGVDAGALTPQPFVSFVDDGSSGGPHTATYGPFSLGPLVANSAFGPLGGTGITMQRPGNITAVALLVSIANTDPAGLCTFTGVVGAESLGVSVALQDRNQAVGSSLAFAAGDELTYSAVTNANWDAVTATGQLMIEVTFDT